jgi:hypothetical protein
VPALTLTPVGNFLVLLREQIDRERDAGDDRSA